MSSTVGRADNPILVPVDVRYTPYFMVSTFPQSKLDDHSTMLLLTQQLSYVSMNAYEKYCTRWAHTSYKWGEI